jgi:hypothetical protein
MKFIVKCRVHDWPKRSQSMLGTVEVDAPSREEALSLAVEEGKTKWPGGKVRAFDVHGAPNQVPISEAAAEKREILRAKVKAA